MNLQKFFASLILGAVLGLALGYSVYTIGGGGTAPDFIHWVNRINIFSGDHYYDAYFWAFGGIIAAGAMSFLLSKNSK